MKKIFLITIILTGLYLCKNADVMTNKSQERISGSTANFGKPTAPIQLTWNSPKNTSIGQGATINYSAIPSVNAEKITLKIRPPKDVEIISGDKELSFVNKNAGDVLSGSIVVKSKVEKLHFIDLDATIKFDSIEQAANTNIQFPVGENPAIEKFGTVTETNGEKYLDIPAK